MTEPQAAALILLTLTGLAVVAMIVIRAWFRAKADHLRELMSLDLPERAEKENEDE